MCRHTYKGGKELSMGVKIALILLVQLLKTFLGYFSLCPGAAGGVLLNAVTTGAILGDLPTGLMLGGTYELMNIGLNPLGESVVPNYNLGSIVGVFFAITVNKEIGTAMGIVVATLATMLNTFVQYLSLPFKSWMEKALAAHQWKKVEWIEFLNWFPAFIVGTAIPVAVVCSLGQPAAEAIMNFVPEWVTHGFSVAGNALPALGFAIVLRSLNVEKNIEYLIIGFALFAFAGVGTVGATLFGVALALMKFKHVKDLKAVEANAGFGGVGDE